MSSVSNYSNPLPLFQKSFLINSTVDSIRSVCLSSIDSLSFFPNTKILIYRNLIQNAFLFTIDLRDYSYRDIAKNNEISLTFFFPLTKEQYRIKSSGKLITKESLSDSNNNSDNSNTAWKDIYYNEWTNLKPAERLEYESNEPGTIKQSHAMKSDIDNYSPQPVSETEPSKNFVLLIVKPVHIDYIIIPSKVNQMKIQRRLIFTLKSDETDTNNTEKAKNSYSHPNLDQIDLSQDKYWKSVEVIP